MNIQKNSTMRMQIVCAIVFITFTYVYLAYYQADVLAAAQHVLSGGMTHYSYVLAPILLTLVLFLLQICAFKVTGIRRSCHALTYFPSFLLLTLVTDLPNGIDGHHSLKGWWIAAPLLLALWGAWAYVTRQFDSMETEPHSNGFFSKHMWLNLLQMIVMMTLVQHFSCKDRIFHQRMRMEHLMNNKEYAKALEVGRRSLQTDSSLTMLRIACLQASGQLGDRLFQYPLLGGSKAMMPDSVTVKNIMWKKYKWMEAPSVWMRQHHLKYKIPDDYKLCALLLDKKLDQFVVELQKHPPIDSVQLPTHYKEALLLYTHRRSKPSVVYHNNVMDADFQDFQQMEHKFANPEERRNAIRDTYGNTYWYYYEYGG